MPSHLRTWVVCLPFAECKQAVRTNELGIVRDSA